MKCIFKILIIPLFISAFFSCKKTASSEQKVFGQWRWIKSTGGFSGNEVLKPSADSIVILSLNNDFTYRALLNNQSISQGKYYFTTLQNSDTVIHFDKIVQAGRLFLESEQIIELSDNTKLRSFDYNVSEGYSHQFDRMK